MRDPITKKILEILFFGIFLMFPCRLQAVVAPVDSLRNLLKTTPDVKQRLEIYVHLADLYADSLRISTNYWQGALTEAIKANDECTKKMAFIRLMKRYAARNDKKMQEILKLAKEVLPEQHNALFNSYLRVSAIWIKIKVTSSLTVIDKELERLKKREGEQMTPEERIEWEFLTGLSIDYSSLITGAYENIAQAIPYIERTLKMLEDYPLEERVYFEELCRSELSDLYLSQRDKRAADEIKKMAKLSQQGASLLSTFQRPFYDDSKYKMSIYIKLIFLRDLITKEEATEYYQEFMRLAKEKKQMRERYDVSSRYYQYMGDYKKAIAYIDSTLLYHLFDSVNLPSIYFVQARLYEKTGDYRRAYKAIRKCDSLRVTIRAKDAQHKLAEMQTRFDVNKLQLDKIRLENRNKQIALIGMLALLLVSLGWSLYQRRVVRKLRYMQECLLKANAEVLKQREKAMESEKMKTAFLNSMCHEIRTPLNAINGFSNLILDDSFSTEEKMKFQGLMQNNTIELTYLLNNILELSQLISSEEPLSLEPCDVCSLCKEKIRALRQRLTFEEVSCIEVIEEEEFLFYTHPFYLSCVLDNLLSNAAKFTEKGEIRLSCHLDSVKQQLIIAVSDTGMGIPPDKQEWVFECFTKIDSFKPGTGLGLYMCRIIISRLGGTIQVDSDYTSGCRIVICLPSH